MFENGEKNAIWLPPTIRHREPYVAKKLIFKTWSICWLFFAESSCKSVTFCKKSWMSKGEEEVS